MKSVCKKLVLIGDFATGKTSLIRRFVDNQFSDDYLTTIGVKISRKNIRTEATEVQALIWDIEGGISSKPLNNAYVAGAHGCIIVADITRSQTISNLKNYITLTQGAVSIPVIIALNKSDLIASKEAEAIRENVAEDLDARGRVYLSSAKSGLNVETLFRHLAELMTQKV